MSRDLSVFTPAVVDQVFERDKGRCAKCGKHWGRDERSPLGGWATQHRVARGVGGSKRNAEVGDVSACIVLCSYPCHHEVENQFRNDAFAYGFAVSRIGVRKPWEVPILHAVHGWCLLLRDGTWEAVNPPESEAA